MFGSVTGSLFIICVSVITVFEIDSGVTTGSVTDVSSKIGVVLEVVSGIISVDVEFIDWFEFKL